MVALKRRFELALSEAFEPQHYLPLAAFIMAAFEPSANLF
jgi:hypothetical protein